MRTTELLTPARVENHREFHLCQVYPVSHEGAPTDRCCQIVHGLEIGREVQCPPGIRVNDPSASRIHCRFQLDGRGIPYIEDLGSSNGTRVNGMKVQHQMLGDQDVIRTGCSLFVVSRRPTVDLPWLRDHGIATRCGVMAQRIALICRAAEMKLNVLCSGETGTGKEVLARLLHSLSKRPGRMVAVNCAAIPDGLVEAHLFGAMKGAYTGLEENRQGVFAAAHRGTLLLDEVGELPESAQIKLLRVLEDRQVVPLGSTQPIPVDVQIVAATNNQDVLEQTTGKFRGDLLARLEDVVVEIPPLRQRKVDILPLACLQLAELSVSSCVMDPDFAEALLVAPWPRNVRQLLKAVSRGAALREPHQSLRLDALDVGFPTSAAAPNNTSELPAVKHPRTRPPKEEFLDVYRACNANISAISRHFGVERKQVYRWLSIWGIGR